MYLRVAIATEHYALPIECVREVDRRAEVTPVPGAPPNVLGLRSLRGEVIPVLDAAGALGVERRGSQDFVVVVSDGTRIAALAVDSIAGVEALDALESADGELLVGQAMTGDLLVGVLDVGRLLSVGEKGVAA